MSASTTKERGATSYLTVGLLEQLPQIANNMREVLLWLGNNPSPAMCEMAAIQLAGAHRFCLTLSQALQADLAGRTSHAHWISAELPGGAGDGDVGGVGT